MDNETITDCLNGRDSELQYTDWLFITFLIALLLIIFFSTILDFYMEESKRTSLFRMFFAFSVYKNGKQLFSTKKDSKTIECLDGIRFLSISWVILAHTSSVLIFIFPYSDPDERYKWLRKISSMTYMTGTVAVDTFFILSGLLIVRSFLLNQEKGKQLNIAIYYIYRYFRLTPVLAFVVAVFVTILPYFGCGPYWPDVLIYTEHLCNKNWWSTLLYIQNYVNPDEICVLQSWYLAVDMQLYLISPLILYSLVKWPKWTVRILFISIIPEIILCFSVTYVNEVPILPITGGRMEKFTSNYTNTIERFGPWVIGVLLGYFIHKPEDNKVFNQMLDNKRFTSIGWMLAIIVAGVIIYGPHKIVLIEYVRLDSAVYTSLHRVVWSMIICWMIYTCTTGHGGIINWFLSLPIFHILSKLTYCIYIIHFGFQIVRTGMRKVPPTIDDFFNVHNYCGDILISTLLALIVTLAIEMPTQNLVHTFISYVEKKDEVDDKIITKKENGMKQTI